MSDKRELTLTGISSEQRRILALAVHDASEHDFSLKTDVTIGRVTEENLDDLLDALLENETELSEHGAYDSADAADRLYTLIRRESREVFNGA